MPATGTEKRAEVQCVVPWEEDYHLQRGRGRGAEKHTLGSEQAAQAVMSNLRPEGGVRVGLTRNK